MSEDQPIVASAIVIPEAPQPPSPSALKRRQSSFAENDNKRPRLSVDRLNYDDDKYEHPRRESNTEQRTARRTIGRVEERKRGQRLFGALLGTLSQSSSTASQRKRADIEKKQQAKLKLQDEEFDQQRKEKLEELNERRRQEQKKYDEQSLRIRHSNLMAMAQFLQTETEPKLFYRPWDLKPHEDARVKAQIDEAEATVDRELEEWEAQHGPRRSSQSDSKDAQRRLHHPDPPIDTAQSEVKAADDQDGRGLDHSADNTAPQAVEGDKHEDGFVTSERPSESSHDDANMKDGDGAIASEDGKHPDDEHGDVVLETEEDTVIY